MYSIPIYNISNHEINPIFVKGCSFILEKYNTQFETQTTNIAKNKLMADLWFSEFNATLTPNSDLNIIWEEIIFLDQLSMTLFLIKLT
jgi:hypothetical protein